MNWHQKHEQQLSLSDRISIKINLTIGSMKFIVISTVIIACWLALNSIFLQGVDAPHWDPYPFILLNLMFSAFAFYASPLILMAGNISAARDKVQAEHQYEHQEQQLKFNTEVTEAMHKLTKEIHAAVVK